MRRRRLITNRPARFLGLRLAGRRIVWLPLLAGIAAALVLADRAGVFGRAERGDWDTYNGAVCRAVRAVDGDTIELEIADRDAPTTTVRLWGVDTPETKHPRKSPERFGPEAADFTRRLTSGQTVRLELEQGRKTRDPYGRLLAWVHLPDGRLLNAVLIEEGFGYADPRFDHHRKEDLRRLQDLAMQSRKGLWEKAVEDDLPDYYRDKLTLPGR